MAAAVFLPGTSGGRLMGHEVRTRFAPSPTGYMHVGGIRTALFAWLLARQAGGQFILRIEDTDKIREVQGSIDHITQSLKSLGINWDEGIDIGGDFGPYKQSERLDIYKQWAQKLIDSGHAYADPYSQEELQVLRDKAKSEKRPFLFREHRPVDPPKWNAKLPLRFKSIPRTYSWRDEVMGELSAGEEAIDDFILIKSDGFPTYNFAHIIDDYLMQISHVIRSQEFTSSIPKYLNLHEALHVAVPKLVTLPYVLNPEGNKKLSKRDSAKDILEYIREGYLPQALVSFIATLGWNDGSEQEIFTTWELIEKFSLSRVQRGGAHFDEKRLAWVNGHFIRRLSTGELQEKVKDYWPASAKKHDDDYKISVLSLVQERLKYFGELPELTNFFFEDLPIDPSLIANHKQLAKLSFKELKSLLNQSLKSLEASEFTLDDLISRLNKLLASTGQKPVVLFSLIRIATTQAPASPGLPDTLSVLGKEVSLKRINQQLDALA